MNINKKFWILTPIVVPFGTILLVVGIVAIMTAIYARDIRMLAIFTAVCCLGSGILVFLTFINYLASEKMTEEMKAKPIVRVWTHNGATRVVPELDWRLWWELYERDVSVGIEGKGLRPNPVLVILFTDLPTDYKTGDMKDCEALLGGCRVEKSELFVTRYDSLSENLETAWKLVHGPDAIPPATS